MQADQTIFPVSQQIPEPVSQQVSETAREITVRVLTDSNAGSGVIVNRQENRYIVLTNHHVMIGSWHRQYTILTADGVLHVAKWLQPTEYKSLDLALVEFTSSNVYQTVEMENSATLSVGDIVYACGFPNWHGLNSDKISSTRDWGFKAYRFTEGKVGMTLSKSLERGYQLGYTNTVESGMSGGPVLNQYGRLVGINGWGKYPLGGIQAFVFIDGTKPSFELFQQMETLSWAIPVTTIRRSIFPQKLNPEIQRSTYQQEWNSTIQPSTPQPKLNPVIQPSTSQPKSNPIQE